MLDSYRACRARLRDPSWDHELRAHRVAPRIATDGDRRRCLVQLPTRCLVVAGPTPQSLPILYEVQQGVVTVQAAEHLAHPVQHARPVRVRFSRSTDQAFM